MNQLKKKRNLLSVLMNNECFVLCVFTLMFIGWFFGTYYVGKLEQFIEITLFHGTKPLTHIVDIWFAGFVVEAGLAIAIMFVNILIGTIIDIVRSISIAKILQFLPVSKEEIKSLNIISYESFEAIILNLFKDASGKISDSSFCMVESVLYDTIFEYLKLDNAIVCDFYDTTDRVDSPKAEFAKLRSEALTKYLFKNDELPVIEDTINDVEKNYTRKGKTSETEKELENE